MIGSLERLARNTPVFLLHPRKRPWIHVDPGYLPDLGGGYLEKVRIPDSVLLVHSKIATISDDNSNLKKMDLLK